MQVLPDASLEIETERCESASCWERACSLLSEFDGAGYQVGVADADICEPASGLERIRGRLGSSRDRIGSEGSSREVMPVDAQHVSKVHTRVIQ